MSSKSGPDILAAYKRAHALLTSRGLRPRLQRLDNEASAALQQFMHSEEVDFQLAPPHVHRRNAAERAIHTFKNHLIAGLCSTDKHFPLNLWNRLLPQAIITLNLLRKSCINPLLSTYAQVHGALDYNRTPLAPPGTKVLIHEKPSSARHGPPTPSTAGTLALLPGTIIAIVYGRPIRAPNALSTHSHGYPHKCKCQQPQPTIS